MLYGLLLVVLHQDLLFELTQSLRMLHHFFQFFLHIEFDQLLLFLRLVDPLDAAIGVDLLLFVNSAEVVVHFVFILLPDLEVAIVILEAASILVLSLGQ